MNERDYWERAAHEHEQSNFPVLPPVTMRGRSKRRAKGSSAAGGMSPANQTDLSVRPLGSSIPKGVPRVISNHIAWDTVKISGSITVSTSSVVETNFSFNLSEHPQGSSWASLFDQWCIPQATIVFDSQYPSNTTAAPAILYTALDFDNNTNISTIANIGDFSTCAESAMSMGRRVVRSIKPCVKPYVASTASSAVSRMWCDCAVTTTPWYCIRSMVGVSGVSYFITYTITVWYAFRNQI